MPAVVLAPTCQPRHCLSPLFRHVITSSALALFSPPSNLSAATTVAFCLHHCQGQHSSDVASCLLSPLISRHHLWSLHNSCCTHLLPHGVIHQHLQQCHHRHPLSAVTTAKRVILLPQDNHPADTSVCPPLLLCRHCCSSTSTAIDSMVSINVLPLHPPPLSS